MASANDFTRYHHRTNTTCPSEVLTYQGTPTRVHEYDVLRLGMHSNDIVSSRCVNFLHDMSASLHYTIGHCAPKVSLKKGATNCCASFMTRMVRTSGSSAPRGATGWSDQ